MLLTAGSVLRFAMPYAVKALFRNNVGLFGGDRHCAGRQIAGKTKQCRVDTVAADF